MEIPASDGKPILAGCNSICAYHKKHVYTTTEAAAAAWADYLLSQQAKRQQTDNPATQQPTETPVITQTTAGRRRIAGRIPGFLESTLEPRKKPCANRIHRRSYATIPGCCY